MQISIVGAAKYEQKQGEVAAAVSVITRSEIRAFGWHTLEEALASLPGVYVTYDRQYGYLGARGFGVPGDYNTRLLVNVNGNRLNDPVYDGGPFGRQLPMDLDLVERIEFIPGPGGAVYGQNAMFGVVNLITRSGSGLDGGELSMAYQHPQSLSEGRGSWGHRFENGLDLVLSASALRSRGEDRAYTFGDADVSGVAAGLDGDRDEEFFARAVQGAWSVDFMYGNHVKDDPTAVYFSDPLVAGQYQADAYRVGQLQYEDRFMDDSLHVLGRVFAGQERFTSRLSYGGAPIDYFSPSDWQGVEGRLLYTAFDGHKLMTGIEAQNNSRQEQSAVDPADPANGFTIAKTGYRFGVYAQDEWKLSPTLTTTLGVRVDRDGTSPLRSSPRAALIWQPSEATTFKALYGRAHRSPNAYERDYDDGAQAANPDLRGERVDTLEVVADHRIGADLRLRASLYQWSMHDLITLGIDPASGLTQYRSGDPIKARGLELAADRTWRGGARLRASASLQDVGYSDGSALLNSPKALGRINFSSPLPWAGLRLGYEWRYDSRRLSVDGSWLGGYAVSNLHLSSDAIAPGLELSLTIGNLFDKRYAQPGSDTNWQNALDQDGRSLRVQLDYRF